MPLSKIIFKPIIGLEVHIELKTKSKMFCSCSADHFGKPPNTFICPVCLGLPGALPVPNKKAVEFVIQLGLALNCQVELFSKFDRKNYFYPDLPKGYQISQYEMPLAVNGKIKIKNQKSKIKMIRIRRVHLEEDTAKMIHQEGFTFLDFNRAGVPLVEIVTEPDFTSSSQVVEFLKELQRLVRWLGIADAEMEKGQMRCEPTVNLEVVKEGKSFYTPLVELKNINSFTFAQKAIDYEIERQKKEFLKTGKTKEVGNKTTRGWDEKRKITVLQREKEEAADYRYFPEPDIPPIKWKEEEIEKLKILLPELPSQVLERFITHYQLTSYQAKILTQERETAEYFEEAVKLAKGKISPQEIANVIINKRAGVENASPSQLVKILLGKQKIKKIKGKELEKIVAAVLAENQKAVEDYRQGKRNAIEFLVGQVMARTKGQADAAEVKKLIYQRCE